VQKEGNQVVMNIQCSRKIFCPPWRPIRRGIIRDLGEVLEPDSTKDALDHLAGHRPQLRERTRTSL